MKYCVEVITEGNNEVSEILGVSWDDMENEILYGGCYPPKKIQVRPDLEGHAVELGVTPKPLKYHKNLFKLSHNCHTKQLTFTEKRDTIDI